MVQMNKRKILVLGAGGMLGHVLFTRLSDSDKLNVAGTVRHVGKLSSILTDANRVKIIEGVEADRFDTVERAIKASKPELVINCIGIIKQLPEAKDSIISININSLFPHRLAKLCRDSGIRLVHFSTDCVFDGKKGNYSEDDLPNAEDLYGRSKFMGEVSGPKCMTIRTSIIGHELIGNYGLVEWFLSQKGSVQGYKKAIFSGFPTVEMADIIRDYVVPDDRLEGLYHISARPISKLDLLKIVAERYGKQISIHSSDKVNENRSLNSGKFKHISGYEPPKWEELIEKMHDHYIKSPCYNKNIGDLQDYL